MDRLILHVDANCFYASVECLHRPELREKPMAVVGEQESRHGIILAANYLAKRGFGVQTAEAIWKAKEKCPQLVTVKADMSLYMRFSKLLYDILLDYTDQVESFGCDEAWLDVTGSGRLFGSGREIGETIRSRVKEELGITVSVGVSFNKIFAKLGSDYKKPDGLTEITRQNYKTLLWPLPVTALLYVGKATARKLAQRGIHTIGALAMVNPDQLRSWLGKQGLMLYEYANGVDMSPVALYQHHHEIKSIGNSTTPARDLQSKEDVKMIFMALAECVSSRVRQRGLLAKTISIHIRDNRFRVLARQKGFEQPTSLLHDFFTEAMALFCACYRWDCPIRSLGLSVGAFQCEAGAVQLNLFDNEEKREKRARLDETVDDIRRRFGSASLCRGIVLKDSALTEWPMRPEHSFGNRFE